METPYVTRLHVTNVRFCTWFFYFYSFIGKAQCLHQSRNKCHFVWKRDAVLQPKWDVLLSLFTKAINIQCPNLFLLRHSPPINACYSADAGATFHTEIQACLPSRNQDGLGYFFFFFVLLKKHRLKSKAPMKKPVAACHGGGARSPSCMPAANNSSPQSPFCLQGRRNLEGRERTSARPK